MTSEPVLLPERLVALLRESAIYAVHEAAERLKLVAADMPEGEVDRQAADAEIWHLDAARKIIQTVGVTRGPLPTAISLTDEDHPVLILRLLRTRLQIETQLGEEVPSGTHDPHRERAREIEEFLARLQAGLCAPSNETRREELRIAQGHHPDLAPRQWPR